jgi:hypothetical protein
VILADLPSPLDHVTVTAGRPYYAPLAELDLDRARRSVYDEFWLPGRVAGSPWTACARAAGCSS